LKEAPFTILGENSKVQRFKCSYCLKDYAQLQSLKRHQQEKHGLALPCIQAGCNYRWTRKYEFKNHLKKKHNLKNDEMDEILNNISLTQSSPKTLALAQSEGSQTFTMPGPS
jgi:hypothetical protein